MKKNRCIFFLLFFQLLEQMKKIIIMKNEKKKNWRRNELGYCPDYIVRGEIVSQYMYCIVTGTARLEAESVL